MPKWWLVARREYVFNLRRPAYLFSAFGTPIFIAVIWFAIFALLGNGDDEFETFTDIGYIDNAGVISSVTQLDEVPYTFIPYETEEIARSDLESEVLDAYYVITTDYYESGAVQRYSGGEVPENLDGTFRQLLLTNISQGLNVRFPASRLVEPFAETTLIFRDTGRELGQEAVVVLFLMPLFFAILFSLAMQTTSSFMMSGLVKEKQNRIIEILITSISPMQLLAGKIIGLALLGLTQITVWVTVAFLGFILGPEIEELAFLDDIGVPVDLAVAGIVYFLLGYSLTTSILSTIGVLADSEQQSNQYAAVVNLFGYLIPIFLFSQFLEDSNGTVPTILSIVPLTSIVSMLIRIGLGAVPIWQIALSIGLSVVMTIVVAWFAAKIYRWGLLMYGKKFTVRDLLQVALGNREMGVTAANTSQDAAKEAAV